MRADGEARRGVNSVPAVVCVAGERAEQHELPTETPFGRLAPARRVHLHRTEGYAPRSPRRPCPGKAEGAALPEGRLSLRASSKLKKSYEPRFLTESSSGYYLLPQIWLCFSSSFSRVLPSRLLNPIAVHRR